MKTILFLRFSFILILLLFHKIVSGQNEIPNSINYQAVLRDAKGNVLSNKPILIEAKILSLKPDKSTTIERSEFFRDTTNEFGLINIQIGSGQSIVGQQYKMLSEIDWNENTRYTISVTDAKSFENIIHPQPQEFAAVPFTLMSLNSKYSDTAKYLNANDWISNGLDLLYTNKENVGIGTPTPNTPLHLKDGDPDITLEFNKTPTANSAEIRFKENDTIKGLLFWNRVTNDLRITYDVANEGIGAFRLVAHGSPNLTVLNNGNVGIGWATPQRELDVNGVTRTTILEITGGNDIVEYRTSKEKLEPGDLVICNSKNASEVFKSISKYDSRVIGIVSGAGGINPGISLKQAGKFEGAIPIAIAGTVKVKVVGNVKAGDLLTTSDTPGRAMRAKYGKKTFGCIIGKAIEENDDYGFVTVLVMQN